MRLFRSLVLVVLLLLWAAPASGAEELVMKCPVCDHVDVDGHGLEPNATLSLTITDVRSGQDVRSGVPVTTDGSGSFSREFDIDLARHPALLANLYEPSGSTLVLAAHANAQAPAHCRRSAPLPYTGSSSRLPAGLAAGLLGAGALLLLVTRRRPGGAAGGPPAGR